MHLRNKQTIVKTVNAPNCHCEQRSDVAISGRQLQFVQGVDKMHGPIASVAALTAQPLAALPPYGCGVPLAGSDRLVQSHSTAGGHWCTAALPDVSLRGAKRRGNLAVHSWITGRPRRKRNCLPEIAPQGHFLALRAQGATSAFGLLAMTNLEALRQGICASKYCQPARRSLSAAAFFSRAAALHNERRNRRNWRVPFPRQPAPSASAAA